MARCKAADLVPTMLDCPPPYTRYEFDERRPAGHATSPPSCHDGFAVFDLSSLFAHTRTSSRSLVHNLKKHVCVQNYDNRKSARRLAATPRRRSEDTCARTASEVPLLSFSAHSSQSRFFRIPYEPLAPSSGKITAVVGHYNSDFIHS